MIVRDVSSIVLIIPAAGRDGSCDSHACHGKLHTLQKEQRWSSISGRLLPPRAPAFSPMLVARKRMVAWWPEAPTPMLPLSLQKLRPPQLGVDVA
jgi:hypothetical protein